MTKLNYSFVLTFIALFFIGCSSDDDSKQDLENKLVIFKSLTTTKSLAFTEETITLDIDGENFTEILVSSNNPRVTITEVSSTTYTVKASEALNAIISVQLKNDTNIETESVTLDFFEHGVKDFKIVEGIEIDVDKTDKIIGLLGEPEGKADSTNGENEFWYYFSKGFSLWVRKSTGLVYDARVYGINWNRTIDDVEISGIGYPYEIGNSWNLPNAQLRMDDVISEFGDPISKFESSTPDSTLRWYVYNDVVFFFFSDSIDNFAGRPVAYINVY
ncbi:hypothetical protein [uncultured Algibacter sp.]|uniref:hypothetical protein n=1 Tax=uncultured Algibacter sp. TaxID=298659 RepID=UPI003217A84B